MVKERIRNILTRLDKRFDNLTRWYFAISRKKQSLMLMIGLIVCFGLWIVSPICGTALIWAWAAFTIMMYIEYKKQNKTKEVTK